MLEQAAINTDVRDAVTGPDRYKNGIVVDSFQTTVVVTLRTHNIETLLIRGDTLRAPFFRDQIALEEVDMTDETVKTTASR